MAPLRKLAALVIAVTCGAPVWNAGVPAVNKP